MAPVPGDSPKTPAWHIDAVRGPSTPSLDHLVGKREQIIGYVQPKRLCRLQVNKQLELGRPQHRQVLGLFTLENAASVTADPLLLLTVPTGLDQLYNPKRRGNRGWI